MEKVSVGANIKKQRLARGMTQKELAEQILVDQSMICQIECGTKTPSLPLGKEIADCLGVSVEELLADGRG